MDRIQKKKENIFPGAWEAIEDWEKGEQGSRVILNPSQVELTLQPLLFSHCPLIGHCNSESYVLLERLFLFFIQKSAKAAATIVTIAAAT